MLLVRSAWQSSAAALPRFALLALRVAVRTTASEDAMLPEKALFKYSILYLFVVFGALVVDRWVA